jgi:hypothetical protein
LVQPRVDGDVDEDNDADDDADEQDGDVNFIVFGAGVVTNCLPRGSKRIRSS